MLYREAVYGRLPEAARARPHGRIGTRLRALCDAGQAELAAEVAMHLQRAGNHAHAVDYLLLAAGNATRRFAYRDAVRTLQDGLALLEVVQSTDRVERELQVLQLIGDIQYWLGDMSESMRAYERQAAVAAAAGLTRAELNARQRLLMPLGFVDPDRGIEEAGVCVRRCAELDDPLLMAHARMQAAGYRCVYDAWRHEDWDEWTSAAESAGQLSSAPPPPFLQSLKRYLLVLRGEHREALRDAGPPQRSTGRGETTSLMLDLLATSGDTVALLRCARLGELLQVVRTGQELAAKNGSDPWLFMLRERWLRTVLMDFEGARLLCERQLSRPVRHPTSQLKAIALVADGFEALERGNHNRAIASFTEARDPGRTGKFFLHWIWRITAHKRVCEALLSGANVPAARRESTSFSKPPCRPRIRTCARRRWTSQPGWRWRKAGGLWRNAPLRARSTCSSDPTFQPLPGGSTQPPGIFIATATAPAGA